MNKKRYESGRIIGINMSAKKGVKKKTIERATVIENHGLFSDAHAGPWHRQVSLLAFETTEELRKRGLHIGPGDFAENLTSYGLDLKNLSKGSRLLIGSNVILEVTQIGKECHAACDIKRLTGDCVMPREGIFARVIKGGNIAVGDRILAIDGER